MASNGPMAPLSLSDIRDIRLKVLANTAALIEEAELLQHHSHLARSFVLSVIAIEESSKNLILLDCARKLAEGEALNWKAVHRALNSHHEKLKANILSFRSQRLGKLPQVGDAEWQDAIERVKELNLQKQAALYVWIGEGGPLTTSEDISDSDKAEAAISLAKVSYNLADLSWREFDARQAGLTTVDTNTRYQLG